MPIAVIAVHPNPTIPPGTAQGGLHIFSGVIECAFSGNSAGAVIRDTLTFNVGRVNFPGSTEVPLASCIVSLASFAYGGSATDLLWAVDSTAVPSFVNVDAGSGTADVVVQANLAVRGLNGIILRVNYILFYI